jgi:hypothetical protein
MQITNKNICKIHNTYAVLCTQGPLASVGNVSPDEGISYHSIIHEHMELMTTILQAAKDVKASMLALARITPGPPARGEEITLIRFRNGFLQECNIYVINGRIGYVMLNIIVCKA